MELVMQKCDPVKSVYLKHYEDVEILETQTDGVFVYQMERIPSEGFNQPIDLCCAYSKEGEYIGSTEDARFLIEQGITSHVQPTKSGQTCCIGFNAKEQKWYGWSHRAIFGFGIGSTVKKGDCAYSPVDKADLEEYMKQFWSIGEPRECESPEKIATTKLVRVVHGTTHPDHKGIGMLIETVTEFNFDRGPFNHTYFYEYPETWGRGEWMARTLADAKQMAIDFANGVG